MNYRAERKPYLMTVVVMCHCQRHVTVCPNVPHLNWKGYLAEDGHRRNAFVKCPGGKLLKLCDLCGRLMRRAEPGALHRWGTRLPQDYCTCVPCTIGRVLKILVELGRP